MNGYSIYEIGRRLKHVKENDLVHGQWTEWLEKVDVHPREAQRFIKIVSDPQLKTTTWSHLGSRALYEITGVPVEEREKKHITEKGEEKSVDEMTIKEIQDLKRQLKQRDEEKSQLESQLEQAQRSESIARKQLEDAEDKEPEVVERYMEPDDYETAKEQAKKLSREKKELEQKVKFYESQRHKEEPVVEKQEAKQDKPIDAREQINRDSRAVEPEVRRMMQYETSANALVSALEEIIDIHDREIDDFEVFDKVLSTLNYKSLKQAQEKINHFIKVGGY
ncbi:pathogenicity island protein [Staphylococcus phage phiRS7]|nr:pathogenicity island protein [Staphylococcus phage phiRS7]AGW43769.1 pathogenicity island protein [Staphylococcus phage phiRS7]